MFTIQNWIFFFHVWYTIIVLTFVVQAHLQARADSIIGGSVQIFPITKDFYKNFGWLACIVLFYANPIDWVLHFAMFMAVVLLSGREYVDNGICGIIRKTLLIMHLFLINHPTTPTTGSVFFFIEASSIFSFALFIWALSSSPLKKNFDVIIVPMVIFNFITYLTLLFIILIILKHPAVNSEHSQYLPTLGVFYGLVKLGLTPALITKALAYSRISTPQLISVILPLMFVTIPNFIYLHNILLTTDVVQFLTAAAALLTVSSAALFSVKTPTQALLISTPLITITLFIGSLLT